MVLRLTIAFVLAISALPANAWVAGISEGICTLEHAGPDGEVRLTYDPSIPLYTIAITRAEPWPETPVFAMRFEGPAANMITTTRHVLSEDGLTLSVSDRGFGNVLNGLEFNVATLAIAGQTATVFDLAGAAPEVAAFRACEEAPSV